MEMKKTHEKKNPLYSSDNYYGWVKPYSEIIERIEQVKKKEETYVEMASNIEKMYGVSFENSYFTKLKKNVDKNNPMYMGVDKIIILSKYLNVTTDYLLGLSKESGQVKNNEKLGIDDKGLSVLKYLNSNQDKRPEYADYIKCLNLTLGMCDISSENAFSDSEGGVFWDLLRKLFFYSNRIPMSLLASLEELQRLQPDYPDIDNLIGILKEKKYPVELVSSLHSIFDYTKLSVDISVAMHEYEEQLLQLIRKVNTSSIEKMEKKFKEQRKIQERADEDFLSEENRANIYEKYLSKSDNFSNEDVYIDE